MRALAALLAVVALPALAAPRQKVAVLDVRAVQGVAPGTATILTAIIAGDTAAAGYDVLSQADIGALIGFEKQKRMLGCGDDSSCLAEIGGALGAEYVMATQVGQIGSRFHLSLQVIDGKKGTVVARVATFSERTEDALAATAQEAVAKALATAKERNDSARAAKVAAAATSTATPTLTSTATPTPAAAPTPPATPPATRTPTSIPTPTSTEGGFFATRRPYVELRGGMGFNRVPLGTSSVAVKPFDGPGLGLRAGLKLSRAWAVEVGGANRKLRHQGGEVRYFDSWTFTNRTLAVEDDVRTLSVGAGAVYSPGVLRVVSFAADVGVGRVTAEHLVKPPFTAVAPPAGTSLEPIEERWNAWTPRFGAEVRVDYPLRWVTLGLRAGMDFTKTARRETARDPYVARSAPPGSAPEASAPIAWMNSAWIVSYPIDLSVRYVF